MKVATETGIGNVGSPPIQGKKIQPPKKTTPKIT